MPMQASSMRVSWFSAVGCFFFFKQKTAYELRISDWSFRRVLFRSALVKLGLDYDSLAAINPRIILVTASAFGSEGPLASRVGFDAVGQAMSGTVHLTGTPDQPYRAQVNDVDFGTALHCAFGIMRSEEHTSELQSLMRIPDAVFRLEKKQY